MYAWLDVFLVSLCLVSIEHPIVSDFYLVGCWFWKPHRDDDSYWLDGTIIITNYSPVLWFGAGAWFCKKNSVTHRPAPRFGASPVVEAVLLSITGPPRPLDLHKPQGACGVTHITLSQPMHAMGLPKDWTTVLPNKSEWGDPCDLPALWW